MDQGAGGLACAVCSQQTNRRCSRCLNVYYCCREHQRQDWKRHKSECPKVSKQVTKSEEKNQKLEVTSTKVVTLNNGELPESSESVKRGSNYSKKKQVEKEGSNTVSAREPLQVSTRNIVKPSDCVNAPESVVSSTVNDNFSSSVYNSSDLTKSAITYEGSSEQEILSESAQQLSTDFDSASTSNVLKAVNREDIKPHTVSEQQSAKHPETPLKSIPNMANSTFWDPTICHRLINDLTQYGVCVLDNFLGRERGLIVLKEVLDMYNSGIFRPGQLVSNPDSMEVETIRSDHTTWINGREPHCRHIGQLINKVDSIVMAANRMPNNGKMGDFFINGRTKAMVACYPGSGTHYVKHVDNPNRDGRCITAIYYLNLDWDVDTCGGVLRVFTEDQSHLMAEIPPIFDRMLFFWSDRRNPHEVLPSFKTRYAITLWYFDAQERLEARRKYNERGHQLRPGEPLRAARIDGSATSSRYPHTGNT